MIVKHTLPLKAKCPDAVSVTDFYEATFTLTRFVNVTELEAACREYWNTPIYQEDLTQKLADRFDCEVRTVGKHSVGCVQTDCVCQSRVKG